MPPLVSQMGPSEGAIQELEKYFPNWGCRRKNGATALAFWGFVDRRIGATASGYGLY